jgi:hypothetical protein
MPINLPSLSAPATFIAPCSIASASRAHITLPSLAPLLAAEPHAHAVHHSCTSARDHCTPLCIESSTSQHIHPLALHASSSFPGRNPLAPSGSTEDMAPLLRFASHPAALRSLTSLARPSFTQRLSHHCVHLSTPNPHVTTRRTARCGLLLRRPATSSIAALQHTHASPSAQCSRHHSPAPANHRSTPCAPDGSSTSRSPCVSSHEQAATMLTSGACPSSQ